jgi:hypothetical protein
MNKFPFSIEKKKGFVRSTLSIPKQNSKDELALFMKKVEKENIPFEHL